MQPQRNLTTATTKGRDEMIKDKEAIAQAQALYRAACKRLRKLPRETVGEVMLAEGLKIAALFDSNGKLAAAYRIGDNSVSDLDGADLARVRPKLMHRKAR
jgi:hypothetical protein